MSTMAMRDNKLYKPSGLNDHFFYQGNNFAQYVSIMRTIIEKTRPDINDDNREIIIDANSPYEWIPEKNTAFNQQTHRYKNGIVLIHGLFDSPCSLLSIATHFRQKNYLVRVILLPGHGTVPGDLLNVTYHEWVKAVDFAIKLTLDQVDNLFVGGFSTGGALALHHALMHQQENIKGLVLLAPAIQLQKQIAIISNINNFIRKTVGGVDWFIKNEIKDYAKYQSVTWNSAHQVYLLIRNNQCLLKLHRLKTPIFVVSTAEDEVLSHTGIMIFFQHTTNPLNRCISYAANKQHYEDKRIITRLSSYPEKRILSFSHVGIPIKKDHYHYGEHGDYQDFLHYEYFLNRRYKKRFVDKQTDIYYGAINNKHLSQHLLQRLTYNADFDFMVQSIDEFLPVNK